jgi:serine/threonine-protein kinase
MATVYLARARGAGGFERDVALKLLHAHLRADEESKLHLLEEAKLAARIRHPNVVPVFEVDEDPFGLYLVMEYVEGETLSGLIHAAQQAGEPLPKRVAARILNDALLGLHAAHELTDESGQSLGMPYMQQQAALHKLLQQRRNNHH